MIIRPTRRKLLVGSAAALAMPFVARAGSLSLLGAGTPSVAAGGGGGGFSLIAHTAAASTNTNNVTTTGINTTGADFIVAGVGSYNPGGAITVSDSISATNNGAASTTTSSFNGHGDRIQLFYWQAPAHVGSGHTFTVSGTGVYPTIWVAAFSGSLATPLDQQSVGGTAAATSVAASPALTPGQSNELIISVLSVANTGSAFSADGGFSAPLDSITGAAGYEGAMAYLKQTTAASVNPTWTWTTSAPAITALATFKFS